jgi:flavin-dependent dehydrogenase
MSLDPMSGVGCGFALLGADMLADALEPALLGQEPLEGALDTYASRSREFFLPHANGIAADSLMAKEPEAQLSIYRTIVADVSLQRDYIALTGRLLTPQAFQRAYLRALARSAKSGARHTGGHAALSQEKENIA